MIELDSTTPEKQAVNKPERDEMGRLLPGSTANPNGRPKGKTIKERVIDWLESHPEDMEGFVEHFVKTNRELAWQMLEGRPPQKTDITSAGNELKAITGMVISKDDKEDTK